MTSAQRDRTGPRRQTRPPLGALTWGLFAVGAAAVALFLYAGSLNTRFFERTTPLRRLSDNVRHEVTIAHLWLEEALAEDRTITLERDVLARFDVALAIIRAALEGGDTPIGGFHAVDAPELRRELSNLKRMVGVLRGDAAERWATRHKTGGTGSGTDQAFDSLFNDIIARCHAISSDVESVLADSRRGLALVNYGLLGIFVLLFVVITLLSFRSRRAAERRAHELEGLVEERTAELAHKETRVRKILDTAGEGLITFAPGGRIESFNAAAAAMFGVEAAAAAGRAVITLLDGSPSEQEQTLRRVREADENIEADGRRSDGSTFPIEITPSTVEVGERTVHTWIVRDVTARKRVEEERRRNQAALQEMNQQLAEARDAAELANQAKSTFLANMSHEIRTPLNAVIGFNELLQDTPMNERQQDLAHKAERSGRALLSLVNSILDFSKIEAGKMEVIAIPFRLAAIIDDVTEVLSEEARKKSLRFETDVAPSLPRFVTGDPQHLRQVLLNLLGNALKFTERGSVTLRVAPEDEAPRIGFSVEDTGCGLPDAVHEALFEPFEQGDTSNTRRYGGSGLGLAISKELASLMGGTLTMARRVEGGSTFTLRLPLPETHAPEADGGEGAPLSDGPDEKRAPMIAGRGRTVLVVEDHELNREVVAKMLEKLGFGVDLAENGRIAVERFDPARHCLVLMDSQMPEMDGYTATTRIRASEPPGTRVPIVALTANATAEERRRTAAAGMDDFLAKPILSDRLTRAVAQWALEPQPDTDPKPPAGRYGTIGFAEPPMDAAVDHDALERLTALGGAHDPAFTRRITQLFVRDAADLAREVGIALEADDRDRAAAVAHRLKGAAGQVGATRVSGLCGEIETALASGEAAPELSDRLLSEVEMASRVFADLNGAGA